MLLAKFDAITRFLLRSARGHGKVQRGLELLEKAEGAEPSEKPVGHADE